jgi:hypothetical protein
MRPAVAGNQGSGLIGRDVPADDALSCEIDEVRDATIHGAESCVRVGA